VVNSRRVYLSPEVLEKYRQEEASASQAQERYDVVDVNEPEQIAGGDEDYYEVEDATEEVIIIQEGQFESQKVNAAETLEKSVDQEEQKPIIIYPEGTVTQPNNYGERPAPVYPAPSNKPSTPPYPPRQVPKRPLPPPPQFRRPPPPSNVRRPPPPSYLPALSRNAPPPPQNPPQPRRPPPPRGPPPSRGAQPPRRPRPRPRPSGGLLPDIKCNAEEYAIGIKFKDKNFVRKQLDCALDKGPCDELGTTIKRMAPDILRGLCPPPCDECKKKHIHKVMSIISNEFPQEWNKLLQQFG